MAALLDLKHLGNPGVIAVWVHGGAEPALVDCGPSVCLDALVSGLAAHGLEPADLRHVILTHIHPDHAGAAGFLVQRNPRLQVHVSEAGARHVVDPSRLEASAREVYGALYDRVFGPIAPVPAENVHPLGDRILDLEAFATPGHAWHHVSFLDPAGVCYAGDAAGLLMPPGRFLYPAAAPPGIDLAAWDASIEAIAARRPRLLRIGHFGEVHDVEPHLERLRARLRTWAGRIRAGASEAEFVAAAEAELRAEAGGAAALYRQQPSFEQTYAGLRRYLDKQADERGGR